MEPRGTDRGAGARDRSVTADAAARGTPAGRPGPARGVVADRARGRPSASGRRRQTWFYVDDFPIVATAARDGLSLDELFQPYIGHLMPAGRVAGLADDGRAARTTTRSRSRELIALYVLVGRRRPTPVPHRSSAPARRSWLLLDLLAVQPLADLAHHLVGGRHQPPAGARRDRLVARRRRPSPARTRSGGTWSPRSSGSLFGARLRRAHPARLRPDPRGRAGLLRPTARSSSGCEHLWTTLPLDGRQSTPSSCVAYLATYVAAAWEPDRPTEPPCPWRAYLVNVVGTVLPSAFVGGPGALAAGVGGSVRRRPGDPRSS